MRSISVFLFHFASVNAHFHVMLTQLSSFQASIAKTLPVSWHNFQPLHPHKCFFFLLVCIPEYKLSIADRSALIVCRERELENTCALTGNSWTAHESSEDRELSLNSALQKLYFLLHGNA